MTLSRHHNKVSPMNYPKLQIAVPTPSNVIPTDKLLEIKKLRHDDGDFEAMGNIRIGGMFKGSSIFIANSETLRQYDFHLGVDDIGCLVVVPVKKD